MSRKTQAPPVPWAEEAEVSVLGGMLIDADAVPVAVELLEGGEPFYLERHRRIFAAMLGLYQGGSTIDPVTVSEALKLSGDLEAAGGMAYIAELLDSVPTAANLSYHARIVLDRWTQRRLIEAGRRIVAEATELPGTVEQLVDAAQQAVFEVGAGGTDAGLVWVHDSMGATFVDIEARMQAEGGLTGTTTGFPDLDEITGGWQPTDLALVAARPSMGKTALLVGMALAAAKAGAGVALFSAEMSKDQITQRMLCHEGLADLGRLRRGRLDDEDFVRLTTASGIVHRLPLWTDDRSAPTVMRIRSKARRALAAHPEIRLVVVDYLGLVTPRASENRTQELGNISADLKALAKDLGVCVVATHQLSRDLTKRTDHRPQLADLRESGHLEEDADLVIMLHREEAYHTRREAAEQNLEGRAELLVRKHRNGPTGEIPLYFRKESTRFESGAWPERKEEPPPPPRRNGRRRPDYQSRYEHEPEGAE